jgi:ParB family chromosome partitioning protein
MVAVPVSDIEADALIRDRTTLDEAQMQELRESIAANGLRLPIEIFELATPIENGPRYGLLSGYRRLMAIRGLFELTEAPKYQSIRAIIRPEPAAHDAFIAMIEENEIRAQLSNFERGRIAVIAAQQGTIVNVEEAVNRLFATSSKAKRSKIRSFAVVFEELGDMLVFPDALTEKQGLAVAQALRLGAEGMMRDSLAKGDPFTEAEEWEILEAEIARLDDAPRDQRRGGRPRMGRKMSGWRNADTLVTSAGITIRRQSDATGYILRFEGSQLDSELMDSLMAEIRALLEAP